MFKRNQLLRKNDAICACLGIKQFLLLESTYGMRIKLNASFWGFHSNRNIMATTTTVIIFIIIFIIISITLLSLTHYARAEEIK